MIQRGDLGDPKPLGQTETAASVVPSGKSA
jgi:hypothetical protein